MDVWLHGTRRPFQPGGLLLPRAEHRGGGTTSPLSPGRESPPEAAHRVFITRDPDVAAHYAHAAHGMGRPRILTVEPCTDVERDPEHGWATDSWRCGWAVVVAVEVIEGLQSPQH